MADDDFVFALATEATEQLKVIRAYRVYQGENPDYKQRAKLAIGVIGSYVRLRATMANERTNDLVEQRLLTSQAAVVRVLPEVSSAPADTGTYGRRPEEALL